MHCQQEDRCVRVTFTTPELKVALERGYHFVDVAEIQSWSRKRYVLLFKNYIKLQSICGFSKDNEAEIETLRSYELAYMKDLQKKEGITLDALKNQRVVVYRKNLTQQFLRLSRNAG